MDVFKNENINRWMKVKDGCVDECMNWKHVWMIGLTKGWMNLRKDERIKERKIGWRDEWMDEWKWVYPENVCMPANTTSSSITEECEESLNDQILPTLTL